jgi:hypothetical protein
MEHRWNEIDRGRPKYSGKTYPSATLSTTNPTCIEQGSNSGLRAGRPAANHLSHGTALNHKLHQREHCLRIFLCYFMFLWWTINRLRLSCIIFICLFRAAQWTHSVSVLKINQLMLHRKIIVFCSEVSAKHLNKAELYYRVSPYHAVNTPRQGFKNSSVNAVYTFTLQGFHENSYLFASVPRILRVWRPRVNITSTALLLMQYTDMAGQGCEFRLPQRTCLRTPLHDMLCTIRTVRCSGCQWSLAPYILTEIWCGFLYFILQT